MASFFHSLQEYNLFSNWCKTLDWLFDDEKFSKKIGWNKSKTLKLTNRIGRLDNLKKENYIHQSVNDIHFPKSYYDMNRDDVIFFLGKSESKSKDLLRHIRNGIAHGRTRCKNINGNPYIEIYDFSNTNRNKTKQTAYIYMPIDYIVLIYKMYISILNEEKKAIKSKKRR